LTATLVGLLAAGRAIVAVTVLVPVSSTDTSWDPALAV
jgi:hypothetical protein